MPKKKYKLKIITAIVAVAVLFSVFALPHLYERHKIKQEYLAKGIYEIEETFGIDARDDIRSVFMICEPPSNNEDLERMVRDFIQEKNLIQMLKDRVQEKSLVNTVCINFVEPSRDFPIGWKSGERNGYFSDRITDHTIVSAYIPYDSTDNTDLTFHFIVD